MKKKVRTERGGNESETREWGEKKRTEGKEKYFWCGGDVIGLHACAAIVAREIVVANKCSAFCRERKDSE